MSTQHEIAAIELVIENFTKALNAGAFDKIPGMYTADGLSMPDEFKSINSQKLGSTVSALFTLSNYKIEIDINQVEVDGNYAFVTAIAKVHGVINRATKTSRDFFVLRKDEGNWKIYRYMFNSPAIQMTL